MLSRKRENVERRFAEHRTYVAGDKERTELRGERRATVRNQDGKKGGRDENGFESILLHL